MSGEHGSSPQERGFSEGQIYVFEFPSKEQLQLPPGIKVFGLPFQKRVSEDFGALQFARDGNIHMALSDGASLNYKSGILARELVTQAVRLPGEIGSIARDARTVYQQQVASIDDHPMIKERGGGATLLAVTLNRQRRTVGAFAIGDTCLFYDDPDSGTPISFPLSSYEAFDDDPSAILTRATALPSGRTLLEIPYGAGQLVLVTDSLAKFLLKDRERAPGMVQEKLHALRSLNTQSEFERFIQNNRIVNGPEPQLADDVTAMLVDVGKLFVQPSSSPVYQGSRIPLPVD